MTSDGRAAATSGPSKPAQRRPRPIVLGVLGVALAGVAGFGLWERSEQVRLRPDLGNVGAATATPAVGCPGYLYLDTDHGTYRGTPPSMAFWDADRDGTIHDVDGRLVIDTRSKGDGRSWNASGRFIAADGTEIAVVGGTGDRFWTMACPALDAAP